MSHSPFAAGVIRPAFVLILATVFGGLILPVRAQDTPETRADAASEAGRWNTAFLAYLDAFKALPERPPMADERRLREKLIKTVAAMPTKPGVPAEAQAHVKQADELLNAETVLGPGDGAAAQEAALELQQAIRLAPWWSDPTLKLARVLQRLQRSDEAVMNLSLYQLADPAGYAALTRGGSTAAAPASSPAAPTATVVSKPTGPAIIYIYWVPTSRGDGVHPKTLCDGQRMADLGNGHFVAISAQAGNHTIKVRDKSISGAFAPGEEHYIRASLEGVFNPHIELRFTAKEEATAEMAERKIVANDQKRTYSLECKPGAPKKR